MLYPVFLRITIFIALEMIPLVNFDTILISSMLLLLLSKLQFFIKGIVKIAKYLAYQSKFPIADVGLVSFLMPTLFVL